MGLDISLYKLTMDRSKERFVAGPGWKRPFKKYLQVVPVEYEEYVIEPGWRWKGSQYSNDVVHTFVNTRHILYPAYKWINDHWSKAYFLSSEELLNSRIFKTFERKWLPLLLEFGWEETYPFFATGNQTQYYCLNHADRFLESQVQIQITNPPIITKEVVCIFAEEIGYQRKGANEQFYTDKMWDSDKPVILLSTLLEHRDKYFSESNFQINIIDKFIEGQSFVLYH